MAEDPTRDVDGQPIPEEAILFEELREPVCDTCIEANRDAEIVAILEGKLGLSEKDRDALRSFIETVFTDPAKILQVKDLDNRVRSLERQNNIMWGLVGVLVAAVIALAIFIFAAG